MTTQKELTVALLSRAKPELCPKCTTRLQDPNSSNGWCSVCDGKRGRDLLNKRIWWAQKRSSVAAELRELGLDPSRVYDMTAEDILHFLGEGYGD